VFAFFGLCPSVLHQGIENTLYSRPRSVPECSTVLSCPARQGLGGCDGRRIRRIGGLLFRFIAILKRVDVA
jgi:hypothetical protein